MFGEVKKRMKWTDARTCDILKLHVHTIIICLDDGCIGIYQILIATILIVPKSVARDSVKIPMDLLKLHKEVFLTLDIFFVNNIPFLLTLSQKICFTAVNHLYRHSTKIGRAS